MPTLGELTLALSRELSRLEARLGRALQSAEQDRTQALVAIPEARAVLAEHEAAVQAAERQRIRDRSAADTAEAQRIEKARAARDRAIDKAEGEHGDQVLRARQRREDAEDKARSTLELEIEKAEEIQNLPSQLEAIRRARRKYERALQAAAQAFDKAFDRAHDARRRAIQAASSTEAKESGAARVAAAREREAAEDRFSRATTSAGRARDEELSTLEAATPIVEEYRARVAEAERERDTARDAAFEDFRKEVEALKRGGSARPLRRRPRKK